MLVLKLPTKQRMWADNAADLTEDKIRRGLPVPADAIASISLQFTETRGSMLLPHYLMDSSRRTDEAKDMTKSEPVLRKIFADFGAISSLTVQPYRKKSCMGCAIVR